MNDDTEVLGGLTMVDFEHLHAQHATDSVPFLNKDGSSIETSRSRVRKLFPSVREQLTGTDVDRREHLTVDFTARDAHGVSTRFLMDANVSKARRMLVEIRLDGPCTNGTLRFVD